MASTGILALPPEILNNILDLITHKPQGMVRIENRSSLSLESWGEEDITPDEKNDLIALRSVCKTLSNLVLERLFARLTIRFSLKGFQRLEKILKERNIYEKIIKFTYLVPPFYTGDIADLQQVLQDRQAETYRISLRRQQPNPTRPQLWESRQTPYNMGRVERAIEQTIANVEEQNQIIAQDYDTHNLSKMFLLCTNLEQVRLLPLVDRNAALCDRFLSHNPVNTVSFSWPNACNYAAKTLSDAYEMSIRRNVKRFSCRFLDLRVTLHPDTKRKLAELMGGLQSLELQLVDDPRISLNRKAIQLAGFCKETLSRTNKDELRGVHIGFGRRVSIPLEDVFHGLTWKPLKYFGVHTWSLEETELIEFLRRHPSLRSIRFRHILLKEGSNWHNILKVIRKEFALKWISLLGIGYVNGSAIEPNYVDYESDNELFDHSDEDTDEENEEDEEEEMGGNRSEDDTSDNEGAIQTDDFAHLATPSQPEGSSQSQNSVEQAESVDGAWPESDYISPGSEVDENDEGEGEVSAFISDTVMVHHSSHLDAPPKILPSTAAVPGDSVRCDCEDDIGDDPEARVRGVDRELAKAWERWAIGNCPIHRVGG